MQYIYIVSSIANQYASIICTEIYLHAGRSDINAYGLNNLCIVS